MDGRTTAAILNLCYCFRSQTKWTVSKDTQLGPKDTQLGPKNTWLGPKDTWLGPGKVRLVIMVWTMTQNHRSTRYLASYRLGLGKVK